MLYRIGLTGAFLALSVSCAAAADMPKLHPIEALCVTYEMSGQMMEGDSVQCHRHYANESYQIQNTTIKIPGMTQTQSQTTVTIGPDIYAINRQAGTATKTKNPMYDGMAKSEGMSPADYAHSMGMSPDGTSQEYLGLTCAVYRNPSLGEICMTDDGILLRMKMPQMTQTATEVRREEGDPAIYALPSQVRVTEGPDLSQGIQGLMKQYQQR
jgi:hypothetical protein